MLLHDSRRDARLDDAGDIVVLEEQDRPLWNQPQIAEALPLVDEALRGGLGPFAIQAAIAARALPGRAPRRNRLAPDPPPLRLLERLQPSPVVTLNRAVAVAMVDGPRPALALIDSVAATGDLATTTCCTPPAPNSSAAPVHPPKPLKPTAGPHARQQRQRAPLPGETLAPGAGATAAAAVASRARIRRQRLLRRPAFVNQPQHRAHNAPRIGC